MLFLLSFQPTYQQESWWISENVVVFEIPDEGITAYDLETGDTTQQEYPEDSSLSFSRNLTYRSESFTSDSETHGSPDDALISVHIYDTSTNATYPVRLSESDEDANITSFEWSHGSAYAFALDGDIYYAHSPEESPIKISEKVLSEMNGLYFSASDKYLAYLSASDSNKTVPMTYYYRGEEAYDYNYYADYVKRGEEVFTDYSVIIWSEEERKAVAMDLQNLNHSSAYHLLGSSWVVLHGKELLLVTWANRWYNQTTLTLCSYEDATCSPVYQYHYGDFQWASAEDYADIVYSNSAVFLILPETRGDNAWQHIAKIEISTEFLMDSDLFLPSGNYDIRKIIAYRPNEDIVVYDAQAPDPWNRHVYATPAGERSPIGEDRCLTCDVTNCTYQQSASVSPGDEMHIAFSCTGPGNSYQAMFSFDAALQPVDLLNITNPSTVDLDLATWTTEIISLSSGFEAIVRIYEGDTELPSVPVTLVVYGGPNENEVLDANVKNSIDALPKEINHAIVSIDVRGSGGRGWKYRSEIYGRLVTVEVEDTLEAMSIVLEKYPRLDKNRVGVFGWSYGGTMTLALAESAPGFFKCAISGAPVINFLYYDAPYTESYMGDAPPESYIDLSLNITAFDHTDLLLIHGLRDETVLFQQSAWLIEALQEEAVPFQLMVYPNQKHDVGRKFINHLHQLFKTFLQSCYQ